MLVGSVAVVVGAVTHAVATAWFLIGTCRVSDTADRVPAPASAQGLLCDRQQHWLNALPYVALASSAVAAVALAVALWRAGSWRWLGVTACVWLPLLVSVGLALPPDGCSDEQRDGLPARSCATVADG